MDVSVSGMTTQQFNLVASVLAYNRERFREIIDNKTEDINTIRGSFTATWCAVTGAATKVDKKNGRDRPDFLRILLENGGNPNLSCFMSYPIYMAVVQQSIFMVIILLKYKADPNKINVTKNVKEDGSTTNEVKAFLCKLPIVLAVENGDPDIVGALVKYGAVYNRRLVEKAKHERERFKKVAHKNTYGRRSFRKYNDILKILEENYNESMEQEVSKIINDHRQTGKIRNFFPILEDE